MAREDQQVNVRMDPDLYERVKRVAAAEERSVSQAVRFALREYVDRVEPRLA